MSNKVVGVGLVLFTELEGTLYAVLQKRGQFDLDKSVASDRLIREKWPQLYQLTAHGRLKDDSESVREATIRECQEELGMGIGEFINMIWDKVILIGNFPGKDGDYANFVLYANYRYLADIRLHSSSGGLFLLRREMLDRIVVVRPDFMAGHDDITMFSDDLQALRAGFALMTK